VDKKPPIPGPSIALDATDQPLTIEVDVNQQGVTLRAVR
jgi:hypothetical protein